MKKSIVISLKNIVSKITVCLLCGVFLTAVIRGNLPHKLFCKFKNQLVQKSYSAQDVSSLQSFFSLPFSKTVYAAMPVKTPTEKVVLPTSPPPTETKIEEPVPASKDFSNKTKDTHTENRGIVVKNHAGKQFSLDELLQKPLPYHHDTKNYKVLVVHTHTTESYFPDDRSNEETKNMIQVGKAFTQILEENNIPTLHIQTVHDVPYTTSYKKSLESITAALKEHPSIEVVVDLHRDALYNEQNEKVKPLAHINGVDAAQVMIVTGTEKGGLPHPDWAENLAFSLKLQNDMLKNYPNLARPVDLRKERFNTHTTKNSIILEVGANGNTIEEAVLGAQFAAQSVANVLLGK